MQVGKRKQFRFILKIFGKGEEEDIQKIEKKLKSRENVYFGNFRGQTSLIILEQKGVKTESFIKWFSVILFDWEGKSPRGSTNYCPHNLLLKHEASQVESPYPNLTFGDTMVRV